MHSRLVAQFHKWAQTAGHRKNPLWKHMDASNAQSHSLRGCSCFGPNNLADFHRFTAHPIPETGIPSNTQKQNHWDCVRTDRNPGPHATNSFSRFESSTSCCGETPSNLSPWNLKRKDLWRQFFLEHTACFRPNRSSETPVPCDPNWSK